MVNLSESWYTNKDLFEMLQGLKGDLTDTRRELAETRTIIRQYNSLREQLGSICDRVDAIENQAKGRAAVGELVLRWGGWVAAVLGIALTLVRYQKGG